MLNSAVQELTNGRLKNLAKAKIAAGAVSGAAKQDAEEFLNFYNEVSGQYLIHAPLNPESELVKQAVKKFSPDTLIKPGSTLSNLGNVRMTC